MNERYEELKNLYDGALPFKVLSYMAEVGGILMFAKGLDEHTALGIPIYVLGRIGNEFFSHKRTSIKSEMEKILFEERMQKLTSTESH